MDLPEDLQGSWGTEQVDASDIIIPKLLLMHGQSMLVQDGKANIGDLVKSTSKKIVATRKAGKGVKVIPFTFDKSWVHESMIDGKWKWKGEEPVVMGVNGDWDEWDKTRKDKDGNEARISLARNFYALLVDEIGEEVNPPIRLQFKRTSKKVGKTIAGFFGECQLQGNPGCMRVWSIGSDVVKSDETYQIFTGSMEEETTKEQRLACAQWFVKIRDSKKVVHHAAEESAPTEKIVNPIKRGGAAEAGAEF